MTTKNVLLYMGGAVAMLFVFAVVLSQAIFLTNVQLALVDSDIQMLDRQNKELEVQVAKRESVETILPLALTLGFSENSSVMYLDTTDKLARNE
jgi:cell division protein FtsL